MAQSLSEPSTQFAFLLRTKLLPPRPAPALLPRSRLTERLLANLAYSVTLVTANAGSGKTTLVADFARTHGQQVVWYQLDHTDADPLMFLAYLAHGIRQAVPSFGEATLSYLQQTTSELTQQPERAVDVLLNEVLDRVEQQFILVLDDYHHLGPETAVHRIVDRLLAYLPDMMHVIIISRDVPPLALARLRAQASLAIIDRAELLFTDEETQQLFRQVFGLELTREQLTEYRERTEGWITALQLIRQVAQRQALAQAATEEARAADLDQIFRQSERDIFDYFAEEVFADEPEDIQRFLLHISLLDYVEVDTCTRLYADANSASILPALVRRNVFITGISDESGEHYRLHPLFRSFLQRRLRIELGSAGVAAEHAHYADYFLETKQWERAMPHLLAAEDFARAASVIAERGDAWITAGALLSLASFAEALPTSALEAHPRALVHRAEVARLQGEYMAAQTLLRQAATLLHQRDDVEGEAEAFHSLAAIARQRGDFKTAFEYLDRAVELTDECSRVRIKCGNTRGLCLMAMSDWTGAELEFRVTLQYAEDQRDEHYTSVITHNLGLPAMIRGDFNEALRWLHRMLRNAGEAPPMPQQATAHLNVARCLLYQGDITACEQHLDLALGHCQLFNLLALRGEIFETYGNLYRERDDAARATEFYERAGRAYDEAGIERTRRELLEEQALLYLRMGNLTTARALLDQLISARAAVENEMGCHTAALARGRIMLAQGEVDAARSELESSLKFFRARGLYYYEAQACMSLASCNFAMGRDGREMLDHLSRALDLAARYDYEYWLQCEVSHNPQLFASAEAAELLPPELRELLLAVPAGEEPGGSNRLAQAVLSKPVADLTINMLDPVEIFRDPDRPLKPDAWITKRARDILCFIASRRYRRAAKDVIINTFWGEADFAIVQRNFHPTISHIRKALNSNQPLKQNFLLYRDGDYQLNSDFSCHIDTEQFDRLIAEGEAARRAGERERYVSFYEEAIALYRGEFMQGCYDVWVEEQRFYYGKQYMRMLVALAAAAQKNEEWSHSLDLAQRILHEDSFREDVHCMIMRAYAALGNRVAVKEQYETLRRLLRQELDVEPVAETQKIYRELLT